MALRAYRPPISDLWMRRFVRVVGFEEDPEQDFCCPLVEDRRLLGRDRQGAGEVSGVPFNVRKTR
jgi:hypothetical protein